MRPMTGKEFARGEARLIQNSRIAQCPQAAGDVEIAFPQSDVWANCGTHHARYIDDMPATLFCEVSDESVRNAICGEQPFWHRRVGDARNQRRCSQLGRNLI